MPLNHLDSVSSHGKSLKNVSGGKKKKFPRNVLARIIHPGAYRKKPIDQWEKSLWSQLQVPTLTIYSYLMLPYFNASCFRARARLGKEVFMHNIN